jgi:hypothetical protein
MVWICHLEWNTAVNTNPTAGNGFGTFRRSRDFAHAPPKAREHKAVASVSGRTNALRLSGDID